MSKKPAPLTSDLLVRKGEATPSSIDPQDRATAPDAPAPEASTEPEAPVMPEPDIVIAADETEDTTNGSRRRLAAVLALVAVVTAGVLAVSMFGTDTTTTVAPLEDPEAPVAADTPSVAPIIAAPGPQSDGAPVPPEAAELRLEPAEATPDPVVAEEPPAPAPAPQETPAAEAPAAPPREAATITPPASETPPAEPEPVVEPAPTAPAPTVAEAGQYLIQLLSVRSEAAATTAWSNLQAAHPDQLAGETLNIEAADLGERGTFYRVRFGAFDAKADATAVCSALKAQGQDCLVKQAQ